MTSSTPKRSLTAVATFKAFPNFATLSLSLRLDAWRIEPILYAADLASVIAQFNSLSSCFALTVFRVSGILETLENDSVVFVDRVDVVVAVAVDDDDNGDIIDGMIDNGEILLHDGPIDNTDVSMIGIENFGDDNTDVGHICEYPCI